MTAMVAVVVGLGAAALVLTILVIARRVERRRTESLQEACGAMGFLFDAAGDVPTMRALADLPLFDRGHSKRIKNVMTGRTGDREVKIFDYRYTVGGGKESHTYAQTVALYPHAAPGLPDLALAPENVFHKIGHAFGYQDINFASNPAFSSRYLLRGPDEMAIRSAFGPDILAYFEQQLGWTVEVQAGSVGIYRSGKRVKPEDMATFKEDTQAVARALSKR